MKKGLSVFLNYLVVAMTFLIFSSCSDKDSEKAELVVSSNDITFDKEGGEKEIHIKTNTSWKITSSADWCTVTPASGDKTGTLKILVTASKNTTTNKRTAQLTVTAGSESQQVAVTQSQDYEITISKTEFDLDSKGGDIELTITASGNFTVMVNADWITETTKNKFTIAPNTTFQDRVGSITCTVGDVNKDVTIRQQGASLNIPADKTGMASDAMALASKMKVGWNLGNSLEACGNNPLSANETMWGNPKTSKKLIDGVKAAGFNVVRIPCAWDGYIEDQTTYKIKSSWLARVKEVVDYCIDNDMYAIINIHWDGGWLENNPTNAKKDEVNKKQKALWEQIAVYFRDYDEHLLFAGTNEVHVDYNTPSQENLNVQMSFNQTFIDAVRSTGGRNVWRNLIVQSYNTNIDLAVKHLKMPVDPTTKRMMAEVHFYDPYEFALQEENSVFLWGAEFAGEQHTSSWGDETHVDAQFASIKTKFVDADIPVVLGEYGAILRLNLGVTWQEKHLKSRDNYLTYVTKKAKEFGIIPCYWDNGATGDKTMGLFDRSSGDVVHQRAIDAIMNGIN